MSGAPASGAETFGDEADSRQTMEFADLPQPSRRLTPHPLLRRGEFMYRWGVACLTAAIVLGGLIFTIAFVVTSSDPRDLACASPDDHPLKPIWDAQSRRTAAR